MIIEIFYIPDLQSRRNWKNIARPYQRIVDSVFGKAKSTGDNKNVEDDTWCVKEFIIQKMKIKVIKINQEIKSLLYYSEIVLCKIGTTNSKVIQGFHGRSGKIQWVSGPQNCQLCYMQIP